jgi:hypothetical protein
MASAPVTPISEWDDVAITEFTTPAGMAGCVAWSALAHLQGYGADIARMVKMDLPADCASEDMWDFLYSLVTEAGAIGYRVASINAAGVDRLPATTEEDMARAVIAFMHRKPVETEEAFDPEWLAKLEAREKAAAA